jgi:gamma-glutamyltranspeptidase/glutathione hydrolase
MADTWPDYMETVGRQNKLGYLAVGVPGTLKAWAELVENCGRLDLEVSGSVSICTI